MTTKVCKCGCDKLVTLPSQNLKICPDCRRLIEWKKEKRQSNYWG